MADKGQEKKGGYGKIHEHPKANTAGFAQNPQNMGKRKPSIKKAIEKMLAGDGVIAMPKSRLVREDDEFYYLRVPNEEALATKLMNLAMSRGGHVSLKAIEMIMQRTDGIVPREQDVQDLYEVLSRFAIKDDHGDAHVPPVTSEKEALDRAEDIDFEELADE